MKAAVLISGGGTNLKALIDAIDSGVLDMQLVAVISNREKAPGINYATAAALPVSVISESAFEARNDHDAAVADVLRQARPQLIVLAGYMRILGTEFTRQFRGQLINLHPSLLPAYKGLDTYNRVLHAGDHEFGASIHFVNAGLDAGPVITQVRLPVLPDDDAGSLKARLAPLEHKLLVATAALFCKHEVGLENDRVMYQNRVLVSALQMQHDCTFRMRQL